MTGSADSAGSPCSCRSRGPDDADDRRRTGLKPTSHVPDVKENELAGALEDRADDLASGLAKLLQLKSQASWKVKVFGFSFDRHTHFVIRLCTAIGSVR